MRKITRRVLILGILGPALLAPLTALGWQGRDYPWWRYLLVIVGGGYLIPVFGALGAWKLAAILQKAGFVVNFVSRALVGIVLIAAFLIVLTTRSLGEIRDSAMWLFRSSNGLALLLLFGLSYAGLPLMVHRLRHRQYGRRHRNSSSR